MDVRRDCVNLEQCFSLSVGAKAVPYFRTVMFILNIYDSSAGPFTFLLWALPS